MKNISREDMREVVFKMLQDDSLVLNTRTIEESDMFIEVCIETLIAVDLLDAEDNGFELTGNDCYSMYGPETCFTLELEMLEHADKEYFEEDFKDYNIATLEELLGR